MAKRLKGDWRCYFAGADLRTQENRIIQKVVQVVGLEAADKSRTAPFNSKMAPKPNNRISQEIYLNKNIFPKKMHLGPLLRLSCHLNCHHRHHPEPESLTSHSDSTSLHLE